MKYISRKYMNETKVVCVYKVHLSSLACILCESWCFKDQEVSFKNVSSKLSSGAGCDGCFYAGTVKTAAAVHQCSYDSIHDDGHTHPSSLHLTRASVSTF